MNNESKLSISIITATWNCANTIGDCLNSIAQQSWPHTEHIIIDGASKDGTLELLNQHRESIGVLVSEPDKGIYDALNKGIARATGDVVGFLHADDLYAYADVLADVAQAFADPNVCAVFGDLNYVRQQDTTKVVRHWKSSPYSAACLARGWMPPHPTLYLRREIYERFGGFDTKLRIAADYDHILRVFSQPGLNPVYLPHVLVKMRVGGASNRSLSNILRKSREDLQVLRRNQIGGIGALAWKNLSKLEQFWKH